MNTLENFRLVVFRAVAEHLSFRKAAEELYLTQPAVSQQIRALEVDLAVSLLDRSGSRPSLTAAGDLLLEYVRQSSSLLEKARRELNVLSDTPSGQMKIGASTTIAQYLLPGLLADFCRHNPRVHPHLISGNTEQIVEAIEQQKIQLGFIEGPAKSSKVRSKPFLDDELVMIVPAAHEWSERSSIRAAELPAAPLLLRERGSGTRRIIEITLEKHGVSLNRLHVAMELDSSEAIKSAVEAGLGVGILSRWAIAKDSRLGSTFSIISIEGVRFMRQFLIAEMKGPMNRGPASEFKQYVIARTAPDRQKHHL
jgi:DNA-binding transcriptional LysR family regulator